MPFVRVDRNARCCVLFGVGHLRAFGTPSTHEQPGGARRPRGPLRSLAPSPPRSLCPSVFQALAGTGHAGGHAFGFMSCERAVGAAEGMNVLAERKLWLPPDEASGKPGEISMETVPWPPQRMLGSMRSMLRRPLEGRRAGTHPDHPSDLLCDCCCAQGAGHTTTA